MLGSPLEHGVPSFTEMTAGYEFPAVEFSIDEAALNAYLNAIDDSQPIYGSHGTQMDGRAVVSPTALAAFALRPMADALGRLLPGSLHGGQDYEFHRPVLTGEQLVVTSRVANRAQRRGVSVLIIEQQVRASNELVLTGRSTLVLADPVATARN